ncbi:prostatic acid phosphatase-like [Nilaparvata lugens]|uniref:prostatic acid phosphatase-like n=1 Tax=Nilaparvata lugens TaxID=108931 RepID=UPI00193DA096|nr:prostatic acid phosphatase-like [Nilaparvata lugens]
MTSIFCFIIALLCFSTTVISRQSLKRMEPYGQVIASNVVFRHGQRTIIEPYPTDPYRSPSYWPEGFGQLVDEGKRQEFALGIWLRKRYQGLLNAVYNRTEIFIQSTDVDRTLMSAASVLAGLYPPTTGHKWNDRIDWQPIPIHTIPVEMDEVLAMKKPCPRYKAEFDKMLKSPPVTAEFAKYSKSIDYLTHFSGEKVKTWFQLQDLYDTMFIEELNNYTLPNWTSEVYPTPLKSAAAFTFRLDTFTEKLTRLKTGPLMNAMINHFRIYLQGNNKNHDDKNSRKVWLLSAHDETVANVLDTLKVFETHNPPYTACVLIELREKNNDYFVTVTYRNSSSEATLLTIPGCATLCPFNQFVQILKPLIPSDWESECHGNRMFTLSQHLLQHSLVLPLLLTTLILALLLLTSMLLFGRDTTDHLTFTGN